MEHDWCVVPVHNSSDREKFLFVVAHFKKILLRSILEMQRLELPGVLSVKGSQWF